MGSDPARRLPRPRVVKSFFAIPSEVDDGVEVFNGVDRSPPNHNDIHVHYKRLFVNILIRFTNLILDPLFGELR